MTTSRSSQNDIEGQREKRGAEPGKPRSKRCYAKPTKMRHRDRVGDGMGGGSDVLCLRERRRKPNPRPRISLLRLAPFFSPTNIASSARAAPSLRHPLLPSHLSLTSQTLQLARNTDSTLLGSISSHRITGEGRCTQSLGLPVNGRLPVSTAIFITEFLK